MLESRTTPYTEEKMGSGRRGLITVKGFFAAPVVSMVQRSEVQRNVSYCGYKTVTISITGFTEAIGEDGYPGNRGILPKFP